MFRLFLAAAVIAAQTWVAASAGPIRGRSTTVTFTLVDVATGAPTAGLTPTEYVSKDGGTQTAAANNATSLGNGQYSLTLTGDETDADSVGVFVTETNSYPVNLQILTEQAGPSQRWIGKFDGRAYGSLPVDFSRGVATVDDSGNVVAADEIRFKTEQTHVLGAIDWKSTGIDCNAAAIVFGSGEDLPDANGNEPGLAVIRDNTSATLIVARVNADGTIDVRTRKPWSEFITGGRTYAPRGCAVVHGTVLVFCERFIDDTVDTIEGITCFIWQEGGEQWTRVEQTAIDGGGFDFRKPTIYGTDADQMPRGNLWMASWYPRFGKDAYGRYDSNHIIVTWTDYLHGSGSPRGFQCGFFPLSRSSETEHYTVHRNRILDEEFSTSAIPNFHGHSVGYTGDGMFFLGCGDHISNNAIHAYTLDDDRTIVDDYETATVTVSRNWFGETDIGATRAEDAPQISHMMPGRNGKVLGTNDTWPSPILTINNVASPAEPCVIRGPIWIQSHDKTAVGGFVEGWENIYSAHSRRGYVIGGGETDDPAMRHYSPDGERWAPLNDVSWVKQNIGIAGDYFIALRESDEMLFTAKIPTFKSAAPIKIAPGADNLLTTADSLDNAVSPADTNTRRFVAYDGRYYFIDNNQTVPNAPTTPPPFYDPVLVYLGCESSANYYHGRVYTQASGQTQTIGSDLICSQLAVACLGGNSVGKFGTVFGVGTASNDSIPELQMKADQSHGKWMPFPVLGDPVNNPTAARGSIGFTAGTTQTQANEDCPMLVAIGGIYIDQLVAPYPAARLSTGNPDELLVHKLPSVVSNEWTATTTWVLDEFSNTNTSSDTPPSGPLATYYRDADNFVTVYFDGANFEIEVTATIDGVAGSAEVIDIGNWNRTFAVVGSVTDDGTDIRVSVLSQLNGIQTATLSGQSLGGPPTEVRYSNDDQTEVYSINVAATEFRDESLTFQQQADLLTTLDCLSTDAELAAETVAAQVDAQLSLAFANVDTQILTRSVPGDAMDLVADAVDSTSVASNAITNDKIATGALTLDRFSGVFPTNFPSLGINASGHVSRVTLADTITTYTGNTPQTGDSYARIGATGSGLTSLASAANQTAMQGNVADILSDTNSLQTDWSIGGRLEDMLVVLDDQNVYGNGVLDLLSTRLTASRAGYLDRLNIGSNTLAHTGNADSFKATGFAVAGDAMTLTNGERDAIRVELESTGSKLDETHATVATNIDGKISEIEGGGLAELPLSENGLLNFQTFFNNGDQVTDKTIQNVTAPKNITITVPQSN